MERSTSVLKFGGSSVSSPERIKRVARIISLHKKRWPNENILVVVSAMGDTTDELLELASQVSPHSFETSRRREMDMLLTAGERISMALLSLALADLNLDALSLTGSQSGIITSDLHGEARIKEIKPIRIDEALSQNRIVIVAGFQGVSETKEVTTLGRGGSDTSAVALGARFKAREVYIYTDVDGLYGADPRHVPEAQALKNIDYRQAYLSAFFGAQVLHSRCLQMGARYQIPIRVLSSFLNEDDLNQNQFMERGTLIQNKGTKMENPFISTVNHLSSLCLIEIVNQNSATNCLKQIQDSKLSWVTLQTHSDNSLKIICKDNLIHDYKKLFPNLIAESDYSLLTFVGYSLSATSLFTTQILELFNEHRITARLFQANDESFQFLLKTPSTQSPALNTLLQKFYALSQTIS